MNDAVTHKVIERLLAESVSAENQSTPATCGLDEELVQSKLRPLRRSVDVGGKQPADSVEQAQGKPDSFQLDNTLLNSLPNSTGRLARMRRV